MLKTRTTLPFRSPSLLLICRTTSLLLWCEEIRGLGSESSPQWFHRRGKAGILLYLLTWTYLSLPWLWEVSVLKLWSAGFKAYALSTMPCEVNHMPSDWYNSFLLKSSEHLEIRTSGLHPADASWEPVGCQAHAGHCEDIAMSMTDMAPPPKDSSQHSAGPLPKYKSSVCHMLSYPSSGPMNSSHLSSGRGKMSPEPLGLSHFELHQGTVSATRSTRPPSFPGKSSQPTELVFKLNSPVLAHWQR